MRERFSLLVYFAFLISVIPLLAFPQPAQVNLQQSNIEITPISSSVPLEKPTTLESIFSEKKNMLDPNQSITLITTGDVMLGRHVNTKMSQQNNFKLPFEKIADYLQKADLVFINLENPITDPCPVTSSGMIFCTNKRSIEGLTFAGIDIANLANNHIYNYKQVGIKQTTDFLSNAQITYTGISGPAYKTIKNTKFAFLGYNDIERLNYDISWAQPDRIKKEVKEAIQNADIVIVALHFGNEYQDMPSVRQKELAHLAIDSGADLIIGNHPHWIQPVEFYKGKPIIYSHGNFVFDQNWSQETREGLTSKFTFYNNTLVDVEFLPVLINTNGQVTRAEGAEKERLLHKFKDLSFKLQDAP